MAAAAPELARRRAAASGPGTVLGQLERWTRPVLLASGGLAAAALAVLWFGGGAAAGRVEAAAATAASTAGAASPAPVPSEAILPTRLALWVEGADVPTLAELVDDLEGGTLE
ncbi:MAG: hypothetical protein D6701_00500 [Gemmatimonadetes bacterium]|nr:MAG: hypothetical protein D6701_00500 [Gemmatimonadota bacterium]